MCGVTTKTKQKINFNVLTNGIVGISQNKQKQTNVLGDDGVAWVKEALDREEVWRREN